MTKRITEITVETERFLIIHRRTRRVRVWCSRCNCDVGTATPSEVAAQAGVSLAVIYNWAAAGAIHLGFTAEGEAFICLKSLYENKRGGL
jgi:hypothetical protein